MKRIYWLLIAAVPVVLWWLSQGGSTQESQPSAPPQPTPEPARPEPAKAEPAKDLPTSSNGSFPKTTPVVEAAPLVPAPVEAEVPAAVEMEVPPAAPEHIEQAAEIAPPVTPQIEVQPVAEAAVETLVESESGEVVQIFDSKDQPLECFLQEINTQYALLRCSVTLPDKEKVRLVLPFGDQAITVNAQLQSEDQGVSRFKIMTLKAGQKKRFEEYLAQRPKL